jgi:hypothetical protein
MKKLVNGVKGLVSRVGFKIGKHSPEILLGAGIVGVVGATVLACKATTKVDEILKETKENVEKVNTVISDEKYNDMYSQEDAQRDLTIIYTKTAVNFVKLYAPAITLGIVSLGCILASHNIMRKRNLALSAAYFAVDKSFKEYRKRVANKFGNDIEKELRFNIKAEEVEEKVTDEKGKEKTQKTTIKVGDLEFSDYARFFDSSCPDWNKNSEYNLLFLKAQQQYANDLLISRGRLFLNEVYDLLGIERTQAGQVVGWVYDTKNPKGDNYVDFGIYEVKDPIKRRFVNGLENVILLDFNVDGDILTSM